MCRLTGEWQAKAARTDSSHHIKIRAIQLRIANIPRHAKAMASVIKWAMSAVPMAHVNGRRHIWSNQNTMPKNSPAIQQTKHCDVASRRSNFFV